MPDNSVVDFLKKKYLTQYHGIDLETLAAVTIVFEGTKSEVKEQQRRVYDTAAKFNGVKADAANGERGYALTFMIAYLRDFGFQLGFMSEVFLMLLYLSSKASLSRRLFHGLSVLCCVEE